MAVVPAAAPGPSPVVILEAQDTEKRTSPLSVISWALYDFANTLFYWL